MDFTRLFTEDQNGIIASKKWDLPDDQLFGIINQYLELLLDVNYDSLKQKELRIVLNNNYSNKN